MAGPGNGAPPPASPPGLGPRRAFAIVLVFLTVQILVGLVVGFVGGLCYVLAYGPGPHVVVDVQQAVVVPAVLAGEVIAGIVAFRMTRRTLPGPIGGGALLSIGWSSAAAPDLLLASSAGVALALLYLFALVPASRPLPGPEWGILARAAISGGWPRHLWAALALVVAPPVEEFLFRGVLLTGLRRSWRLGSAGAVVILLFVVAHFSEIASYSPAIIAVALVGGATLVARVATGSLVPAIAVHASYNFCIVVWTYVAGA